MKEYDAFTKRPLLQAVAAGLLKLAGWKVEANFPDLPKYVLIVAHHTSNWDFPVGLFAALSINFWPQWIGKDSLFKGPFGGLMKWLGGIPVVRNSRSNFVEQVAELYRTHDQLVIAITPEGTRKKTDHWKTGFYRIALAANVPIVMAYLDFKGKVAGIGPVIHPSGDIEADLIKISEFYATISGKYPEKQSDIRLQSTVTG